MLLPVLVAEGVLSHTVTFECVAQCFELSQRQCSSAMHRQEPSTVSPLCTRAVAVLEPDVLVTYLAIERAGDYDLIGRPVVYDSLVQLQAPRHGHVECVSHVLLHGSRPECQAAGVTRVGPNNVFLYFDLALSSHSDCGFFRASVRLARSLLEHPKLTRWSVNELVVLYVQEGHQSTACLSVLFHACGHLKKVCSSPLCASDVQYSQEFYIPGQHIRDLNCCAAKSWLLHLISPTPCSFHYCIHQGPLIKRTYKLFVVIFF